MRLCLKKEKEKNKKERGARREKKRENKTGNIRIFTLWEGKDYLMLFLTAKSNIIFSWFHYDIFTHVYKIRV